MAFTELKDIGRSYLTKVEGLKPIYKVGIIFAGYAFAIAVACVLTALRSPAPNDSAAYSQGMTAESDSIVFFEAWAFLSLAPTLLALWLLRGWENFWKWASWVGLGLALTAPLAESMNILLAILQLSREGWWSLLSFLGLVRLFAIPFMLVGFLLVAWISPDKRARKMFLLSAGTEAATGFFVLLLLIFRSRFF